ncbi:MAG: LolA family protein [Candidatus Saccharicenans sp.]
MAKNNLKQIIAAVLPPRLAIILFLALGLASLSFSQVKTGLTPEEIALKLEVKLKSITALQAEFKQFYYSTANPEPLTGHGKFYLRKPDRMRWEYEAPEKQIFLYQAGQFWLYFPEDKQLIKNAVDSPGHESEILSLITGNYHLVERYFISFNSFPSDRQNVYQIKLTPREESDFKYILLEIDRASWLITKAVFFDQAGNKLEYWFNRLKTPASLPDKLFELRVPPDCEIIESPVSKSPAD